VWASTTSAVPSQLLPTNITSRWDSAETGLDRLDHRDGLDHSDSLDQWESPGEPGSRLDQPEVARTARG
jgi:hypothetical protein